ncbi:isoprenylcysteine carboxylmethyltransferase family protein [Thermosyntropha sp.]|uniref:methyltransferase family protein n=1 Tax=Thermosyntropha sp. TaxID=2740820 RepID=UPI0025D1F074|nr:isoprenylcysteine carboxylmethyltransferase family protein [Thermosyntropha sp.]MBO8159929.1 isoprenylcysteine carboxylmethyltransferase family protein [Thermosyntropha sp.]
MNSRQRNVLIRIIVAVAVFLYIAWIAYKELPSFDFKVITVFFAMYLLWTVVAEILIYKDPDSYVIEDDDRRSYIYVQFSFLIALFYAAIDFVELNWTRIKAFEPVIIYFGFALFIVSCLIRWWGFNSLGKYFNPRVAIYENHVLITEGAYKKIRHPLYLGTFISVLSFPLIFNSWGALFLILFLHLPALIYRIEVEEKLLLKYFGDEYRDYMQMTKRMIPGIW